MNMMLGILLLGRHHGTFSGTGLNMRLLLRPYTEIGHTTISIIMNNKFVALS